MPPLSLSESYLIDCLQKFEVGKVLVGAFYEMTLLTSGDDLYIYFMQPSLIVEWCGPGVEIVLDNFNATPLCGRVSPERFDCLLTRELNAVIISYTVVETYLLYSCCIEAFEGPYDFLLQRSNLGILPCIFGRRILVLEVIF